MSERSAAELAEQLVRPEVRALTAYHVPDPGGLLKLDAMESPHPWPGALMDQWLGRLRRVEANRYPDPGARRLTARLREAMGVPAGLGTLLGNGSDELIQLILMAVAGEGRSVLAPEPSFVMYGLLARALGFQYRPLALDPEDFSLPREAVLAALERHRPAVVFLAYPNNPTGNLFDRATVDAVLEAAPGLVVVDEAYGPFAGESYLAELARRPNLLLLRTFSKMGLAGLRLGWLAGHPDLVGELDKVRLPYNVNTLTQVSVELALEHLDVLEAQSAALRGGRDALVRALGELPGVRVWPSRANFVLFRVPEGRGRAVFEGLKGRGVLVKCLDGAAPALADCLRVTVSTGEENRRFLAALAAELG
jgi:histidinol-phosphate aminotransferase